MDFHYDYCDGPTLTVGELRNLLNSPRVLALPDNAPVDLEQADAAPHSLHLHDPLISQGHLVLAIGPQWKD